VVDGGREPASHGGFTIAGVLVQLSFDFNVTAPDSVLNPHWEAQTVEVGLGVTSAISATLVAIGEFTASGRDLVCGVSQCPRSASFPPRAARLFSDSLTMVLESSAVPVGRVESRPA
jgi:hypothetical protein